MYNNYVTPSAHLQNQAKPCSPVVFYRSQVYSITMEYHLST